MIEIEKGKKKNINSSKTEIFYEEFHKLTSEQETLQREASKYHIQELLSSNLEEKKELKAKKEQAFDASFSVNRKIRNLLES